MEKTDISFQQPRIIVWVYVNLFFMIKVANFQGSGTQFNNFKHTIERNILFNTTRNEISADTNVAWSCFASHDVWLLNLLLCCVSTALILSINLLTGEARRHDATFMYRP